MLLSVLFWLYHVYGCCLLLFFLMFWVSFGPLGPPSSTLLGDIPWLGGLFPLNLGLGKGPSAASLTGEPEPSSCREVGHWAHRISLSSETVQQINCSCALEFPQHTNLHDVKQLGGNPSMPCPEAELPMSSGD